MNVLGASDQNFILPFYFVCVCVYMLFSTKPSTLRWHKNLKRNVNNSKDGASDVQLGDIEQEFI